MPPHLALGVRPRLAFRAFHRSPQPHSACGSASVFGSDSRAFSPLASAALRLQLRVRLRLALHTLDGLAAEEAIGLDHEGEDHEDVGQEVLGAAADVWIDVAGGHALHRPDQESSDHGSWHAVEPAEDHGRKDLEANKSEVGVDTE